MSNMISALTFIMGLSGNFFENQCANPLETYCSRAPVVYPSQEPEYEDDDEQPAYMPPENPLDPNTAGNRRFDATLARIRQEGIEADRLSAERNEIAEQIEPTASNGGSPNQALAFRSVTGQNAAPSGNSSPSQAEPLRIYLSAVSDGMRSHICFSNIITTNVTVDYDRPDEIWNSYKARFMSEVARFSDGSGNPKDFKVQSNDNGPSSPSIEAMREMNINHARRTGSTICEINL